MDHCRSGQHMANQVLNDDIETELSSRSSQQLQIHHCHPQDKVPRQEHQNSLQGPPMCVLKQPKQRVPMLAHHNGNKNKKNQGEVHDPVCISGRSVPLGVHEHFLSKVSPPSPPSSSSPLMPLPFYQEIYYDDAEAVQAAKDMPEIMKRNNERQFARSRKHLVPRQQQQKTRPRSDIGSVLILVLQTMMLVGVGQIDAFFWLHERQKGSMVVVLSTQPPV